jgi:hypothetical protein
VSARVTYLPVRSLALQLSAGRLEEAEAGEGGGPRVDLFAHHRVGVDSQGDSVQTGVWATTLAWGRNAESDHASNAFLAETSVTLRDRDTWFGRFETTGKTGHDLQLMPEDARFTVAKLQGGYTRYLPPRRGFAPGLGAALSAAVVPESIRAAYGSRVNPGAAIFVTVRPARAR